MKKLVHYLEVLIILTIFWIVLNERFSIGIIVSGFILGFITVYFTETHLISDYKSLYSINLFMLMKYSVRLILEIYLSGFSTIKKIISGRIHVGVIEFESTLKDDLLVCLLANSITLTPGTVTMDKKENRLKVLCLDCSPENMQEIEASIRKKFENVLSEGAK